MQGGRAGVLACAVCVNVLFSDAFPFFIVRRTQVSVTPDDVPSDQCGVSAILNDDERMELFALGYDGEIHHKWQNYDGTWSNWVGLGGNFSSGASVVRNIDGRVEVRWATGACLFGRLALAFLGDWHFPFWAIGTCLLGRLAPALLERSIPTPWFPSSQRDHVA